MPAISSIMCQNIISMEMHLPTNLTMKQYETIYDVAKGSYL